MTRQEHLQWCKERALEYIELGDLPNAFASMTSDLNKHEDTKGHSGIMWGMKRLMAGALNTQDEMRAFIEGFN